MISAPNTCAHSSCLVVNRFNDFSFSGVTFPSATMLSKFKPKGPLIRCQTSTSTDEPKTTKKMNLLDNASNLLTNLLSGGKIISMPVAEGAVSDLFGKPLFFSLYDWFLEHGSVYKLAFGPKAFVVVSDPIVARHILRENAFSYDKALSSAYVPIGAVLMSPEFYDVIYSQSNKLERDIVEQVNRIAPKFQEGLKAFSDSPIIGEIRGTGLILETEFTDNKSPNDHFPPESGVGAYFVAQCQQNGLLVRALGDIILMSPPLIMTPREVDELIQIYGIALKKTERVEELKSKK